MKYQEWKRYFKIIPYRTEYIILDRKTKRYCCQEGVPLLFRSPKGAAFWAHKQTQNILEKEIEKILLVE